MPRRRSYRKLVQRKFTLFLAMVVIFLLLVTLAVRSVELWQIQKLYLAEEQVLKEKIAAEEKRGEEITEYEKYTQTKKYVEEVAKDKLGLVKKYSGYESKLDEIRQAAGYIAQVNAKLRNFEIAKNVDTILTLTGEMK